MAGRKARDAQLRANPDGEGAKMKELVVEPLELAKPVSRRGRRVSISSEEIDTFCRALNAPATFEVACGIVGFSPRTMHDWISKGQDPDQEDDLLIELAAKYAQTMAGGNRGALMRLNLEHAVDDAKAAIEMMRVLIPSTNTVKNVKVEATVESTSKQVAIPFHLMTDDELRAVELYEKAVARVMALV